MCACVWGGVCVSTSTYKGSGGGLVAKLCRTLVTSWTVACQAPLSMGFFRPEYWSELPFSSPGDLPDPESNPGLLNCRQILYWLSCKGSPIRVEGMLFSTQLLCAFSSGLSLPSTSGLVFVGVCVCLPHCC